MQDISCILIKLSPMNRSKLRVLFGCWILPKFNFFNKYILEYHQSVGECSGSVVVCLTRDRGQRVRASPGSLSKNINPSFVLVQTRKTCLFINERLLMGRKESNQTNKNHQSVTQFWSRSGDLGPNCLQRLPTENTSRQNYFSKNSFRNTCIFRVSNSLHQAQA